MVESAEERKRKRLEAWRRRKQQQSATAAPAPAKPVVKVSLSLNVSKKKSVQRKANPVPPPPKPVNPFGGVDDDSDESDNEGPRRGKLSLGLGFSLTDETPKEGESKPQTKKRKRGRWDAGPGGEERKEKPRKRFSSNKEKVDDTLDKFMDKLEAGALGSVTTQISNSEGKTETLSIDVGGSVMRLSKLQPSSQPSPISGGVITPEQLAMLTSSGNLSKAKQKSPDALYTSSDWESDAPGGGASEVSD